VASGVPSCPRLMRIPLDRNKNMNRKNTLLEYIVSMGLRKIPMFSDGAILNPGEFPLAGVEATGAVLFADLPGHTLVSSKFTPVQCTYRVNQFFAWFEAEMRGFGGIVDKFIGDEIMVIYLESQCSNEPSVAAITAAKKMLENDAFNFTPKIGIASGPVFIGCVGTKHSPFVSAMGNTVNIAARLAGGIVKPCTIRVGTDLLPAIQDVFTTTTSSWSISEPFNFSAKNLGTIEVVDILRQSEWVRCVNYWEEAEEAENLAREHGAIIVDPGKKPKDT
jgi:class 3 adenylate cyclase